MAISVDDFVPEASKEEEIMPQTKAEAELEGSPTKEVVHQVPFYRLFRFLSKSEAAMLALAFIGACIQGAGWPVVRISQSSRGTDRKEREKESESFVIVACSLPPSLPLPHFLRIAQSIAAVNSDCSSQFWRETSFWRESL
jgi:hypothetical protein